jgi:hypothetical protein
LPHLVPLYRHVRRKARLRELRRKMRSTNPLNIIIGGEHTEFDGWFHTDIEILDVTSPQD